VELRRLTIADLDSYFENRLQALQDSPSAFLTTYAEEVARGNSWFSQILSTQSDHRVIFGAVEGGRVVGTLGLSKEERPKLAHKAVIWEMFVDGGKRGAGIGGQLLDMGIYCATIWMEKTARQSGESAAGSGGDDSRWRVSWQGLFLRPFVPKPSTRFPQFTVYG
jgi:GNAT superfamily N-acetyltransferase